jgi:hypothetical protein
MSERVINREKELVAVVTTAIVTILGGVGVASYSGGPAEVAAVAPEQAGTFNLNAYGAPHVLDCNSADVLNLLVTPGRKMAIVVVEALRDGRLSGAARLVVGPSDSVIGYKDWEVGLDQQFIDLPEYKSDAGASRELGDAAVLNVRANDEELIEVRATCR